MNSLIPEGASPEARAKVPRAIIAFTLGAQRHEQGDQVMYDLPVPIVVAGWRRLGYEPIVVLVLEDASEEGRWGESPPPTVAMLREMGVELLVTSKMGATKAGNTAQIIRLALPAHPTLFDAELVITSDADSLPVLGSYFEQRDAAKAVTVYNADIIQYRQFAMCYVSAGAAAWREFMQLPKQRSTLSEAFASVHSGGAGWSRDQIVMTERLKAWPAYKTAVQFVELPRTKPFRLDRICCKNDAEWEQYVRDWRSGTFQAVDFHLFRYSKEVYGSHWRWTKDILRFLFPEETVEALDAYYKRATGA